MGSIGVSELLIILVILLLLFGASKLPQLARSIGLAKKEFDEAVAEGRRATRGKGSDEPESSSSEQERQRQGNRASS